MKKLVATALVGSALLLSNGNAEASTQFENTEIQRGYVIHFNQFFTQNTWEWYYNNFNKQQEKTDSTPVESEENNTTPKPEADQSANETDTVVTPTKPQEEVTNKEPEVKPAPSKPENNITISAVEQAVLNLTNAERQKAGLSPLQADQNLMASAREKSKDMATKNYFSHTSPTYGSPFDQMKQFGVTYKAAGENIAMGQRNAEAVVKAWMDSPGHRENILKPNFTHIGIGYVENGNYWTQQFIQK